jgi:hypothetical protein
MLVRPGASRCVPVLPGASWYVPVHPGVPMRSGLSCQFRVDLRYSSPAMIFCGLGASFSSAQIGVPTFFLSCRVERQRTTNDERRLRLRRFRRRPRRRRRRSRRGGRRRRRRDRKKVRTKERDAARDKDNQTEQKTITQAKCFERQLCGNIASGVRVESALKTPIPDRLLHNKRPSKKSSSSNFMSAPAPLFVCFVLCLFVGFRFPFPLLLHRLTNVLRQPYTRRHTVLRKSTTLAQFLAATAGYEF